MWRAGHVRVITSAPGASSVPLGELFSDARWADAVAASPLASHHLSAMSYESFVASPTSRVLSYRWNQLLRLNCPLRDPAEVEEQFVGDVALSVLQTPPHGWTALWADALNHLNVPAGLAMTLETMGGLYLAAPTLPQYFLVGGYAAAEAAMSRGWMHQEVAYGRLDERALDRFVGLCLSRHKEQTGGRPFRGNPFYLEGPNLLAALVGKRLAAVGLADDCFRGAMQVLLPSHSSLPELLPSHSFCFLFCCCAQL